MESPRAVGGLPRNGLDAFAPCKKLSQSEGVFPDGVKPGLHDVKHHGFNRIKEGITVIRAKRVKFKLGVVLGGYRNALAVFEIDNVQFLAADQDAVGCSETARRPFGVVYSLFRRDERFIGEFHSDLGDVVDVGVRMLLHLVRPERVGFDDLQSRIVSPRGHALVEKSLLQLQFAQTVRQRAFLCVFAGRVRHILCQHDRRRAIQPSVCRGRAEKCVFCHQILAPIALMSAANAP